MRLAIFLSVIIGLIWGYCWNQHDRQHRARPALEPVRPAWDGAAYHVPQCWADGPEVITI